MNLRIFPPDDILQTSLTLPKSKSMSARALIINRIQNAADIDIELSPSSDTAALATALNSTAGNVNIGAAGTAMRFLTAYYAAMPGTDVVLDGNERMQHRPIGILVDALRQLGADIEYVGDEGFPPLKIRGKRLTGGTVNLDTSVSSQFVSALMMVTPLMDNPLTLLFDSEPVSLPYIKMTAAMMANAGVNADVDTMSVNVPATMYTQPVTEVERDWSAASYWYAIAALTAGWVTLCDMSPDSLQGDSIIKLYGARLGVVTDISEDVENAVELSASPDAYSRLDADMSATPDLVPTLAVAAASLGIPFRFTGVHTLRTKETDRLEALKTEAEKLGWLFDIDGDDVLGWEGRRRPVFEMPRIDTYDDHRMAMAFAPVSIFVPGIIICDHTVVDKSYPQFWQQLADAGFTFADADEKADTDEHAAAEQPQSNTDD